MERLSTPVFWPGEFHELNSSWGHKESDTTEQLSLSLHFGKEPLPDRRETRKRKATGNKKEETKKPVFTVNLADYRENRKFNKRVQQKWLAQSYPTLCHPMDYTVHGILQERILEWVASPFSRGSSQADSLPTEPPGKPKNTGMCSLSLLQGIFPTQESNWGLLYCRWILYQLSYQ